MSEAADMKALVAKIDQLATEMRRSNRDLRRRVDDLELDGFASDDDCDCDEKTATVGVPIEHLEVIAAEWFREAMRLPDGAEARVREEYANRLDEIAKDAKKNAR